MSRTNIDEKPSDDNKDFHGDHDQTGVLADITLLATFGKCGAYSRHSMRFQLDIPIANLKKDIETMVKIPTESQAWLYMNRELNNFDTLRSKNVPNQAIIEVKRSLISTPLVCGPT